MRRVVDAQDVAETRLWKQLKEGFNNPEDRRVAEPLSVEVADLCSEAQERIKLFPYFHAQYTLHDQIHMCRVTELMAEILQDTISQLNPIELALLILAAYYHDQGMVPEPEDWEEIKNSVDYKLSLKTWELNNSGLRDVRRSIESKYITDRERGELQDKERYLLDAHRSHFLRGSHGERSEAIANRYAGDKRLDVHGTNLASLLGRLCKSHVLPASDLEDANGFRIDERIGRFSVNIRYLALVLRLADLLDLDQDRTPEVLFKTIHFGSEVSLAEWEKHRSVKGWEVNRRRIRFSMSCAHPVYQKAAYRFMDFIDRELAAAHHVVGRFPRNCPEYYKLNLPNLVERDRIEPKNDSYIYLDLELKLSRDEIVRILLGENLYGRQSICIRELLQNSLDALRYRAAMFGKRSPHWEYRGVKLEHTVNPAGFEVISCSDDGAGMDLEILRSYLTNAGRSYYRSPEFEEQRLHFAEEGSDFDPCARFGIGFMSVFMLGDRVRILTRRDYGPGKRYGDPLDVEINGVGGLLVVRDGNSDQPVGTTIEITGRRKPVFLDSSSDIVRLLDVVRGHALATEFKVSARCTLDGIEGEVVVPETITRTKPVVEELDVTERLVIDYEFSEVDERLSGAIWAGFLQDDAGLPCLRNKEARLVPRENNSRVVMVAGSEERRIAPRFDGFGTVCVDGIYVCGTPARGNEQASERLGWHGNRIGLGDPFILDVRGTLKPTLTPARHPPDLLTSARSDPSWRTLARLANRAYGHLWEKVAGYLENGLHPETFWSLSLIHAVPFRFMRSKALWDWLQLPIKAGRNPLRWVPIRDMEYVVEAKGESLSFCLKTGEVGKLWFPAALAKWICLGKNLSASERSGHLASQMKSLVLNLLVAQSELEVVGNDVRLVLTGPSGEDEYSDERSQVRDFVLRRFCPYAKHDRELLYAESFSDALNLSHPIIDHFLFIDDVPDSDADDCDIFARILVAVVRYPRFLRRFAGGRLQPSVQLRRLGLLYGGIDWDRYREMQPPYRFWERDRGYGEITVDDLSAWADFPSDAEVWIC